MTISFLIDEGDTVNVVVAQQDSFHVTVTDVAPNKSVVVIPGSPGPAFDGTAWWYGEGPPNVVVGSKKDDYYMDTVSGVVYRLE